MATKKKLSAAEREELLKTLKARFEKNMSLHKGIEWAKVQSRLSGKCGLCFKWKKQVANRMLLGLIKNRVNIFSWIVLLKVRKNGEVFVTIMKHWKKEKNINRRTVP